MRILYFDCYSGISGDMSLGAFVDAGMSFEILKEKLSLLKLEPYEITEKKVMR